MRHWKQAQVMSRSKSRRAKGKSHDQSKQMTQKPNSKDGAPGETDKAENEEVFQGKHPWVVSSPHTRVQVTGPADQAAQSAVEDQVNSTAVTATPAATADQTDPEVITHLRALKKALGSLPEQLEEQLKSLEAKTDKTLTHGHINKLGKLQKQLANLNTKISEMDHNWKVFTETVMQKFGHHQKMYQQCRQKLLQGVSPKKPGDSRGQGGSPECIGSSLSSTGGGTTSSCGATGCRQYLRECSSGRCIHGYGTRWGGLCRGGVGERQIKTRRCSVPQRKTTPNIPNQGPCWTLERKAA